MAWSTGSLAMLLGLGLFGFAGFQTIHYRDYLSMTQQEFQAVPIYVFLETLVAFALSLWGCIANAGTFKQINPYASQRGLDAGGFRPDFISFNHRGHLMPLEAPALNRDLH